MTGSASAWRDADFAPWMITLPAGEFTMGASDHDKFANDTERPVQQVTLVAFAIGRAPVTVGEFRAFRPEWSPGEEPRRPVAGVSWEDATAYCGWLTAATSRDHYLPCEAEWEYACRAGTRTPFSTGAEITPADANFLYLENGARVGPGGRTPVAAYPANAFGLHDMHGNVCEWCSDRWRPDLSAGPMGSDRRVIRGGGWDYLPRLLRSAWRDGLPVHTRRDNLGFRVAALA